MRLTLRFLLPLAAVLGVIAFATVPLVDGLTYRWTVRDLEIRSELITHSVDESAAQFLTAKKTSDITPFFRKITQDERLYALGLCNMGGKLLVKTQYFPASIKCSEGPSSSDSKRSKVVDLSTGPVHVSFSSILSGGAQVGSLVVVHDLSFLRNRSTQTKKYLLAFFIVLGCVVAFVTVLTAQLSLRGWVKGLRAFLRGENLFMTTSQGSSPEFQPIIKDLRALIKSIGSESKVRDSSQTSWSPKALKEILQQELAGDEVIIVSNREPYIHVYKEDKIEIRVPASGLVTALEPIMRACSGTWVAHGSGSADRAVVDSFDRVRVPPENPSYRIRRVWLTKEEEEGYYYGFANEGLWPLCHNAHVRPVFRTKDWEKYIEVNQKFADAVIQEAATEDPVILVQDYHFALVPKMIREKLPGATIITFWHIPWPNSEAFGICPWREEILDGLLGSSIVGFHTRFHCNNFVEAIDRIIESRIDRETLTISYKGHLTAVHEYPISIEYPSQWLKGQKPVSECRAHIREAHGLKPDMQVGIGVDRLDYTKGILERFLSVERLFELDPEMIGRFTFIQIAAPSRSHIPQYKHFEEEVCSLAEKINLRFGTSTYKPIILLVEHREPKTIFEYFRGADLCFVSSLHDGMNLVAKEFVSARDDEGGVLILSQFTGASRELPEALIVNPYNIDQCSAALQVALKMPRDEQRSRMRSMRSLIQEFNVYRWAGRMLLDASRIRHLNRIQRRFKKSHSAIAEALGVTY